MEYRINQRTGDKISVIGLGTSYIAASDKKTAVEALSYAYEHGINYADLAGYETKRSCATYRFFYAHAIFGKSGAGYRTGGSADVFDQSGI